MLYKTLNESHKVCYTTTFGKFLIFFQNYDSKIDKVY